MLKFNIHTNLFKIINSSHNGSIKTFQVLQNTVNNMNKVNVWKPSKFIIWHRRKGFKNLLQKLNKFLKIDDEDVSIIWQIYSNGHFRCLLFPIGILRNRQYQSILVTVWWKIVLIYFLNFNDKIHNERVTGLDLVKSWRSSFWIQVAKYTWKLYKFNLDRSWKSKR